MSGAPGDKTACRSAVIFLNSEYEDEEWHRRLVERADVILAADGGARVLLGRGVMPDAVIGDFDSLDDDVIRRLTDADVRLIRHPVRKDVTDGELAVEEALSRGADELVLVGATGALDHTLGHLAILRHLAVRGVPARLLAPGLSVAALLAPAAVELGVAGGTRVSLVSVGDGAIVTLSRFHYPLRRGRLPADACLGLGNHVAAGGHACITVHEGGVFAVVEASDEPFARIAGDDG